MDIYKQLVWTIYKVMQCFIRHFHCLCAVLLLLILMEVIILELKGVWTSLLILWMIILIVKRRWRLVFIRIVISCDLLSYVIVLMTLSIIRKLIFHSSILMLDAIISYILTLSYYLDDPCTQTRIASFLWNFQLIWYYFLKFSMR